MLSAALATLQARGSSGRRRWGGRGGRPHGPRVPPVRGAGAPGSLRAIGALLRLRAGPRCVPVLAPYQTYLHVKKTPERKTPHPHLICFRSHRCCSALRSSNNMPSCKLLVCVCACASRQPSAMTCYPGHLRHRVDEFHQSGALLRFRRGAAVRRKQKQLEASRIVRRTRTNEE